MYTDCDDTTRHHDPEHTLSYHCSGDCPLPTLQPAGRASRSGRQFFRQANRWSPGRYRGASPHPCGIAVRAPAAGSLDLFRLARESRAPTADKWPKARAVCKSASHPSRVRENPAQASRAAQDDSAARPSHRNLRSFPPGPCQKFPTTCDLRSRAL